MTASPATVDFLVALDQNFESIVTNQLGQISKDAIRSQQDPSTMSPLQAKRVRKEILHAVYGE